VYAFILRSNLRTPSVRCLNAIASYTNFTRRTSNGTNW